MNEAVILFTAKSIDRILREGGTSSWRLDPGKARRCAYAVCVRNAHSKWGDGKEVHHTAFIIGKVSEVTPTEPTPENDESPKNRYLIQFSEYAETDVTDAWPKGFRNPVRYGTLAELGIDPKSLKWVAMPEPTVAPTSEDETEAAADVKTRRPIDYSGSEAGLIPHLRRSTRGRRDHDSRLITLYPTSDNDNYAPYETQRDNPA